MELRPYTPPFGLSFGDSQSQVIATLGPGSTERRNRLGEVELRWVSPPVAARFGAAGLLEASFDDPELSISGEEVSFVRLESFLRTHDRSVFARDGFVVSPLFGVALDPAFPAWITMFSQDRLVRWKAIGQ